jgi:energy-coupling factor transporter ATP-binding protein EcfA2
MSVIFAESFNQDEPPLSKTIVNEAKAKLKQHKVIVITGPQKCGKTTLSALLASVYRRGEYLIITKADEMKYVSLNKVCLLVIEDFAGKCQFDSVGAGDWMRKFDFLDRVVKAGKLNVIITCEDTLLDKCNHSILHNVVQMNESDFNIKQEIGEKPIYVQMHEFHSQLTTRMHLTILCIHIKSE